MSNEVLSLEEAGLSLIPEKKQLPAMPQRTAEATPGYSHPYARPGAPYLDPQLDPQSNLKAGMIAAGRSSEKIGHGLQQLYYGAMGNQPKLEELAAKEAEAKRIMAPLEGAYPWSTGFGAAAPAMAIPVGGAAVNTLGGAAKLFAQGAAVPALSYGSAGERVGGAVLGGAGNLAGSAIGQALGTAMRPAQGRVTPENEAFAKYMKDAYGVTTLPGSLLENNRLKRFESQLSNQLGTSNAASDLLQANQRGFNRAAASAINQSADNVGDTVRNAAQEATSRGYEELAGRAAKSVDLSDPVKRAALDAYKTVAEGRLKKPPTEVVDALNTIIESSWKSGSKESQQNIGKWVSDLGEMQRDALKAGQKQLAEELSKVKSALNDARYAKSPAGDREARALLDKQQATLYTLDGMRKTGAIDDLGNVSVGRVDTALRKNLGRRTGAIRDPLSDLAEYNARFKPMSDSGTAGNVLANDPIKGSMLNPMQWPGAAKRSAYLSPAGQAYMKHGVLAPLPGMIRNPLEELMAQQIGGMPLGLKQLPAASGGLLGNAALYNLANGQ